MGPHPKLMLKLHHGVDTDTAVDTDTVDTVVDTTATDTARGLLRLNPKLRLRLHHGADTTVVDTDTVIPWWILRPWIRIWWLRLLRLKWTLLVKMLKKPLKLPSGSSHSNSFNLATIPSIFCRKMPLFYNSLV